MDTVVSAKHFLEDQIPVKFHHHIPTSLKSAYKAANLLIQEEPILQVASAIDNGGRIISWAVDAAFEKLIKSGQWPFDYRWVPFDKPTGRYLEIRLNHSVMSVSQIHDPRQQPRNVRFRENKRLNNQPFFDMDDFEEENSVNGLPHFLLVHGHQELNFAHLAVPNARHSMGYIYKTANLMQLPHELPNELPPVEDTDFDATMTLKEEIERWRKENDDR
ncbi:hypothetical protein [Terasakiella sp.]|uniref:hypothetical protein n=1 Tax=Terasakiella sp. TaxID=2034861 RepID=UPI003AA92EA9